MCKDMRKRKFICPTTKIFKGVSESRSKPFTFISRMGKQDSGQGRQLEVLEKFCFLPMWWNLRLFAIKQIAPLFAAFDRPHYQKLLPTHLHEVLTMSQESFEDSSFVCSINGSSMHSVPLDEAHEMLVNKDLKTTVVRPTKEYIDRIIYYISGGAKAASTPRQREFDR